MWFCCPAKSPRYVRGMSAIGFTTPHISEIDELRNAYGAMNDVLRTLRNVRECLGEKTFAWQIIT